MWFAHKASLMASVRKALLVLALLVVMLQMASTPAKAEQQSGGQTPPATQQDSVTPPADNSGSGGGDNAPAGGDDKSTTNQSTTPANNNGGTPSAGGAGITVDPVKDTGDTAGDSKTGTISIHCRPGFEVVQDQCVPNDEQSSSSNSEEGPILIHCGPDSGCSKEDPDVSKDEQSSSSNSKEDSDAPKDEQSGGPMGLQAGDVSGGMTTPAKEDTSSQQAPTVLADGQAVNNEAGDSEVTGCPGDYYYDEGLGRCMPELGTYGPAGAINGISGIDSVEEAIGDGIASPITFPTYVVGDSLKALGIGTWLGLDYYGGNNLVGWGEDIGGPLGWPLEGVGYTVSAVGDVAGYGVEGAGQVLEAAADGIANTVGEAVNLVGDAAGAVGDAVGSVIDDIGSWF